MNHLPFSESKDYVLKYFHKLTVNITYQKTFTNNYEEGIHNICVKFQQMVLAYKLHSSIYIPCLRWEVWVLMATKFLNLNWIERVSRYNNHFAYTSFFIQLYLFVIGFVKIFLPIRKNVQLWKLDKQTKISVLKVIGGGKRNDVV